MNNFDEIKKLWLEFYELPFPSGLVGEEINGICVTTLDTFTAGCIDTFVSAKGHLDRNRKSILMINKKELEAIIENINGEAKSYFEKLLILTNKVLKNLNQK